MLGGIKYMLGSMLKFVSHSATDGSRLFKGQQTSEAEEQVDTKVDSATIKKNMKIACAIFGTMMTLCINGVLFYTSTSAIAGGHFLLLAVFFGYKFWQSSNDLMNFIEGGTHGRTEKRQ